MADTPSPAPRSSPWPLIGLAAVVVLAALAYLFWPRRSDDGILRWGGDATGGEPYLILRPNKEPSGFEGELIQYLGEKIHRTPQFRQNDWDSLLGDLQTDRIDVAFNGIEWSPEREETALSTVPYFAYRIRLIVRKDSPIRDWEGLRTRKPNGKKQVVGVLKDSAAHRYLQEHFGDDIEINSATDTGVTGYMGNVRDRQGVDATVQDGPAAKWYLDLSPERDQYRALYAVGEAIRPTKYPYYVAFVRDAGLRDELNAAIEQGLKDGSIRKLLEKYGLWDADQADLLEVGRSWPPPESPRRPALSWFLYQLFLAALVTAALAVTSFPIALVAGLLIAIGRLYGPWFVRLPLTGYVEVVRGTPLALQLVFIFYFLPYAGLKLSAFTAGVIGLAINYAAYEAEIYRAGLQAIPPGQMEAALALGMSPTTALWRIIVPQAVRIVIPPVANDFIALFKDTAVCAVVAINELTAQYRSFAVNNPNRMAELALLTALLYLLMSIPLSILARWLESRQEKGKVVA
jgi:polar amino acid transport system substrate-binding protein